jgi:SAM-dependent methyltransferase
MPPRNLDRLRRVYGPTTWDVYERLDVSLDPTGPDSLLDTAGKFLAAGQMVLDAGCRDGAHLIELVRRFDVDGVGVEPVALHVERAIAAVDAAGLAARITVREGVIHELPYPDAHFDFVWCRDVVEQVDDLSGALRELIRVMKPDARLLVYTTVATDLLITEDADMLRRHLGNVHGNLDRAALEQSFDDSGLGTESVGIIGTEWREYAEERTQPCHEHSYDSPVCAGDATRSSATTGKTSTNTSRPTCTGRSSSFSGSSNRSCTCFGPRTRRSGAGEWCQGGVVAARAARMGR